MPRSLGGRWRVALAICLIAHVRPLRALDPSRLLTQAMRETWQTEQGLPQNSVGAIARTRDGYLWAGTEEGLARFDGTGFEVFDRHTTPAFSSNTVNALLEDRRGRLWIGTAGGVIVRDGGAFRRVGPPDLRIAAFLEDEDGLWVGTLGSGLMRFDAKSGRLAPARLSLRAKRIRAIAKEGAKLWLASEDGLVAIDGPSVREYHVADGLLDENLFALLHDPDGSLWVGSDRGVQRLRDGRFESPAAIPASLAFIRVIRRDAQGALWIGTQGNGVARLRGDRVEVLRGESLSSDVVVDIVTDVEDNVWLGTGGGGLMRLRDGKIATFGVEEGLPAPLVFSLFRDRSGAMWFGTRGGGVSRLSGGVLTTWSTRDGLPAGDVVSIAETGDGTIWLGTYGGGLASMRDGRISAPLTKADGLGSDAVYSLLASRDGSLLVGTGGAGLRRVRGSKVDPLPSAEMLGDAFVQCMLEEPADGTLWVGTNEGLTRIRDGVVHTWTTRDGLPTSSVIALARGRDGSLWLGTPGRGVVRFRDDRFATIDARHGLPNEMIGAIVDDGHGRFWLSSNRGIFSVAGEELEAVADGRQSRVDPVVYGAADGMRSAECYGGSSPVAARDAEGRLWFATIRGAAVVDPARLPVNRFGPPVVIRTMTADGTAAGAGARLAAGTRRLDVTFAALALRDPARVRFQTMLEGFDERWNDAGTARTVSFTNLHHGRYRFLVRARNEDGVWSPATAQVAFAVLPHVWETWWFRLAGVIGVIGLVFAAHRFRVARLEARQRELEEVVDVRTRELAEANRELERLARVDGLTGIANRRSFDEALRRAWADERRRGGMLAVVLCDIDQFKKFNDSQGHQAGDETLRSVAQALAAAVRRETDLAARYGGEEMVLLLPGADAEQARAVAETALENVRRLQIPHPASEVVPYVTLSLGIAAARPAEGGEPADLVHRADEALYHAKTSGRNRCVAA